MNTGASFNRHASKQDYHTPNDFREAVVKRFGKPHIDLAAKENNYFSSGGYVSEETDSLKKEWFYIYDGLLWLNPPFNDITPWAKKCAEESEKGAEILFLTPASIGSEWFAEFVWPYAHVLALRPRLCFDGKAPYPKDCILSHYCSGIPQTLDLWKWK